jgi:thiamine biosynthesis lipoprotein
MVGPTRHVFSTMGTTVSVTTDAPRVIDEVERVFAHLDARFSLFRAESELSRVASGLVDLADTSEELRDLYGQSLVWRQRTGGAFTPHRPDGVIDLNGIVKAEAMRRAGVVLGSSGVPSWCLNVGGDVLSLGLSPDGWPWTIGIVDPADRAAMLCSLELRGSRRAVATSGGSERGEHIWLGGSHSAADFAQVTVVANDIITADVLATAIVAGGIPALNALASQWPIDVLAVDHTGSLSATPGMRAALMRA